MRAENLDRRRNPVAARAPGTLAADANGNRRLYTVLAVQLWAQTRFGSFNVDPEPELSQWADREGGAGLVFALFEACALRRDWRRNCPVSRATWRLLRGPWPADLARRRRRFAQGPAASAADSLRCIAELTKSRRWRDADSCPPHRL
jgi:hypothetical protein